MTNNESRVERVVFGVLLIVLWQAAYVAGVIWLKLWKPYAFPSPLGVLKKLLSMLQDQTILLAVWYSLVRGTVGFAAAILIGIVFGLLIYHFPYCNRNLKPLFLGVQTLPSICWVPFAILWFGLKDSAILFVVIMGAAFSVALTVESCMRNVNPLYVKLAQTMGASKADLYLKVILPASLPSFLAGLRQAWSFAWRALMSGEVMSASVGLGYMLVLGRDLADIDQVMLVMLVIICVGVAIDKCIFSAAENRMLKKRGLL